MDTEKGVCSDSLCQNPLQGFLHGTNLGMNGDGTYPAELAFVLLLQCSYQTYTLIVCWFLFSDEQWELHLLFVTNSFSCLLPCQIYLKEFLEQWKKCYKKAAIYEKSFY